MTSGEENKTMLDARAGQIGRGSGTLRTWGGGRDLIISGVGSTGGGSFNKVLIDGVGKVTGDVECDDFFCNGTSTVNGSVKSRLISINGVTTIGGGIQSDKIRLNGKCTIRGGLSGDNAIIDGLVKVEGDCELERFAANGVFTIGGLLNAGSILIQLHGPCRASEIGGETIRVKSNSSGFFHRLIGWLFPIVAVKLATDSIEGDDIDLEHVKCAAVRGNNIRIGPGCEIGQVEYRGHYDQAPGAKVGRSTKV